MKTLGTIKEILANEAQINARIREAKLAGIKEVVEWIENNGITQSDRWGNTIKGFWVSMPADPKFINEWEAQLKIWGIKK